ncbi:MAG: AI-2E family transporter [Microbacterium sp.]|uniref:AI-2E family transporter n=1 Tax=Microbacterium sp. TaxID=51671 RepID=UPI000DB4A29F|nr:AI-2E family transporter [Microbacterium sp.]PZU37204.1 MAG: AI-2E family transporter [Microbacterium sp.]
MSEKTPRAARDADDEPLPRRRRAKQPRPAKAPSPADSFTLAPAPGDPHYVVAADTYQPTPVTSEPARSFWARIDRPFAVGLMVTLGALTAFVIGLAVSNLSTVLIYIMLALFAALGLEPIVNRLMKLGVPRGWSIVIVVLGLVVVVVAVLWLIIPTVVSQISQFIRDIPTLIQSMQQTEWFQSLEDMFGASLTDMLSALQSFLTDPGHLATIGGGALQFGVGLVAVVSGGFTTLVLTLFFLGSLPTMKQAFYRLTPARGRTNLAAMTEQITGSIGSYLMGQVTLAFANSVVAFILHALLGLPFPALMAVLAFLITLIPMIGSVLFWIFASIIALFTSPVAALIFALVYLVYMQIEAYVLTPRIMSRAVDVPGALVVIGALVGGTLLGLIGALVAIPISASILLIIKQIWVPRQDAKV